LSEAEGIGVKAVATLDQDWHRVDSFDVYTMFIDREKEIARL
jgi:hypothetical protein